MPSPVRIKGLRELERAWKVADKEEQKLLRKAIRQAATPVKQTAEGLSRSTIPRIGGPWSVMRIGYGKHIAYVTTREKGRASRSNPGLRRAKFKDLLLDRAMIPAVESHKTQVVQAVENVLATTGRKWERA